MAQQKPSREPDRPWLRRLFSVLGGLAILYTSVVGLLAFVAPDYLRHTLQEQLSTDSFGVAIERLEINPLRLSTSVIGFRLQQNEADDLLSFDRLDINFSLDSLIQRALTFDEVVLDAPHVTGELDGKGAFQWARYLEQLLAKQGASEQGASEQTDTAEDEGEMPPLLIYRLALDQLQLRFIDLGKREPFAVDFGPTDIEVHDLSTLPRDGAPYAITASTERTELIEWRGDISLYPLRSSGTLDVSGIRLPMVWQYFEESLNFELSDGVGSLNGRYRYDGNLMLEDVALQFDKLRLRDRGEEQKDLIEVPELKLRGIGYDMAAQRLDIAAVELRDPSVWEVLDQQGASALAGAFAANGSTQGGTSAANDEPGVAAGAANTATAKDAPASEFSVGLHELSIHNGTFSLRHRLAADNVTQFVLSETAIALQDFAWPEGSVESLGLDGRINESASLSVRADGDIDPLQANFTVVLSELALVDLLPYIESRLAVDLQRGSLGVDLAGQVSREGDEISSAIEGSIGVSRFLLVDTGKGAKLLSFEELALEHLSWTSIPPALKIEQVALQEPYAKVVIYKDGSTNLSRLVVEQAPAPSGNAENQTRKPSSPEQQKGPAASVAIDAVELHRGTADFTDLSLPRKFKAAIYDIEGGIKGLSSTATNPAGVDITGAVDRYAPVTLQGEVNPLSDDLYVDLALAFRNMEMTAVSPYSDTYAGYNIDKGKLNADFKYHIDGGQLEAENNVIIDQLTLGESTGSPTATSLPVVLAVALLKDKNGVIDVNLPVSGDLNDPEFHYGALIGKAIVNLITKIVTSPFAALGKLVGGGEDMDYVPFDAGMSEFSAAEASKLTQVAEALNERPQLSVSVRGVAVMDVDTEALREIRLTARMEQLDVVVPVPEGDWKAVYKYYKKTTGSSEKQLRKQIASEQDLSKHELQQATRERIWQDLLAAEEIDAGDYEDLARARAEGVREALIAGGVDPARVFLLDPVVADGGEEKPHCQLELDAK